MEDYSVSNWIWTSDWEEIPHKEPVIVYFRKEFEKAGKIKISANCRYKLYINDIFVQEGPQKGTTEAAFVDTADVSAYLQQGKNVAAIEVLYYPEKSEKRNDSLYYSPFPCLYIADAEYHELDGTQGWKYCYADHIKVTGEPFAPAPIHGSEIAAGNSCLKGWRQVDAEDGCFQDAKPYGFFEVNKPIAPFHMVERTIPAMEHHAGKFTEVVCVRRPDGQGQEIVKTQWEKLLKGETALEISPNTTQIVEITAGEEMCGYPSIKLAGGAGAQIRWIYAESYGIPQEDVITPMGVRHLPPVKNDRTDYQNGSISGAEDLYTVSGHGTTGLPECYEPYLFRTFRFIRIEITTREQGMSVLSYDYCTTGYPLIVKNHPVSEREEYNKIWDISLRTLKRCMHETYVDCPYYEQLQYTMDSRAEILFTYEVAEDDRLARQCMDSFRKTQRSDGMIQASAPAQGVNVIPGFSIFYILMVHDHMRYFGDRELVKKHFSCIDGILRYFDEHLTEKGLVGSVGGVLFAHKYWSFVDWCAEWDETIGVPKAGLQGERSITMESLLYLYGLKAASELAGFIGRDGVAEEYLNRAAAVSDAIRKYCMDEQGMIQDGPGLPLYSTHCQVWAILNDIVTKEQGKKNLMATYRVKGIPQCSVSMSFYLFLACEKLGILKEMDSMWNPWREMLQNNLTTCVENFTDQRSDCHAWGSIMLYALPRLIKAEQNQEGFPL